jgi:hypothetical protein
MLRGGFVLVAHDGRRRQVPADVSPFRLLWDGEEGEREEL